LKGRITAKFHSKTKQAALERGNLEQLHFVAKEEPLLTGNRGVFEVSISLKGKLAVKKQGHRECYVFQVMTTETP
jgi:hypothetical protein